MISDYHILLGTIAVVLGIVSYVPYFRDIFRGRTKPHPFSWFLWGVMNCIAIVAQFLNGAGPGVWLTVITAVQTFFIVVLSFRYGEKQIVLLDWVCLVGALLAIGFWVITSNAMYAVIIITVTHFVAMIPTIRKSFFKPHEETALMFALNSIKWIPAIFALQAITLTTALYPAALVVMNGGFVLMLLIRRKQLNV